MRPIIALTALLALASPATAEQWPAETDIRTGAGFLAVCGAQHVRADWDTLCTGYVIGMAGAFNVVADVDLRFGLCAEGVIYADLRAALVQYLRANPDDLGYATPASFFAAISEAFPCGQPVPKSNTSEYRF